MCEKASENELKVKSCFKLSMTEEGVLSYIVLQYIGGIFKLLKRVSNGPSMIAIKAIQEDHTYLMRTPDFHEHWTWQHLVS